MPVTLAIRWGGWMEGSFPRHDFWEAVKQGLLGASEKARTEEESRLSGVLPYTSGAYDLYVCDATDC